VTAWGRLALLGQRPLLGWGYSASTDLLPAHAADIGFTVNQAHNALLRVALSVGMVGLVLVTALLPVTFGS
jgi:O-antigen ligase